MPIKLNTASGGGVILTGANTATDKTITVPAVDATMLTDSSGVLNIGSGQVYKDTSGNVGIGTTSPGYAVDVRRGAGVDSYMLLAGNNGGTTSGMLIGQDTAGLSRIFQFGANPITFWTNSSERARIDSSGNLLVGTTNLSVGIGNTNSGFNVESSGTILASRSGNIAASFNRNSSDGQIVSLRQDGTEEGNISVSGTTVSYNGGHLARWAQTVDNTRIPLVKGTVMSNLDQMAVWEKDGEPLPNEQLNCMKVSDVEGDVNVAGVFVNWDNDDDVYTNDMNIAMTGDMIIRIAQGVTVQKGDLLMSAGDGTAKPQGDDIVRSKTVAKVTSSHVTCTYDDGSYCVPCVLMAC